MVSRPSLKGIDLSRWSVRAQLTTAFGLLIVLCLAVGAVGQLGMMRVGQQAAALHAKWLAGVGHLSDARTGMVDARAYEVKHSRAEDRSYHSEYEEKIAHSRAAASKGLDAYAALLGAEGSDEHKQFAALQKSWAAYNKALDTVVALGKGKKQVDAADVSDGLATMAFDESIDALGKLLALNFKGGEEAQARAAQEQKQGQWLGLALTGIAAVLALILSQLITRGLVRQLGGEPAVAAQVVSAVAAGDLTVPIRVQPADHASLMARIAEMQHSLKKAVDQVRSGAESVASSSSQIAHGNQELSSRTEQQASSLQQTAATMDELGTTVRNNADHARQASELARGASEVAMRGGEMVGAVVSTMKDINQSSRKIADIIGTIDGIAFQTNILALNAAVEAARAGEQGRGFAVVAAEVRSLAQRSAGAAKEIKGLIGASVDRVAEGTALVDKAGHTMQDIVQAIRKVSDAVGEISVASTEQSNGVVQVSQAVSSMDRATQQNAALVEESAAAAETLRAQAQDLLQSVAVFRTDAQGSSPRELQTA
ncbi:MAG: MCP four helix bundle domain-containing protein [Rubrivivax sp.]|nr:MCP four helix bundle domain-containing protein [Rubrivivax sp.]